MSALTIHDAATATGWSPRMLRYVEQLGLLDTPRSPGGYRLYGPAQIQRLRTLRDLLERHRLDLGQVGFALRLRREPELAADLDAWFGQAGLPATSPADGGAAERPPAGDPDWLAFEQLKHQHLLAADRLPSDTTGRS
jgi:MerR family copper efflux transcriptional regulator